MRKRKLKQFEKFVALHVKCLYAFDKAVEEIKTTSQEIQNYAEIKTICPVCGQKSFISNKLNFGEFKCTNPECGFELSIEKIKKGI